MENLVGYAKADLIVPAEPDVERLDEANTAAREWCEEVNAQQHSEICAIPAERLVTERELWLAAVAAAAGSGGSRCARSTGCHGCGSARPATRSRSV